MTISTIVVALTGASGSGYGYQLIKGLSSRRGGAFKLVVIFNDTAMSIMEDEIGISIRDLEVLVDETVHSNRMDHALASGSNRFDHLVICPCTTSTASKVHAGIADNLVTRLGAVALKERRGLIMVVRESPLTTPVLKALHELSSWGVVVMPASPPFYGSHSDSIEEMQKSFAGRIMDLLGMENEMVNRYG
ncbi:MAG: UbiX family flavin prenyltransferase [Thermoplasmatota archaeon]